MRTSNCFFFAALLTLASTGAALADPSVSMHAAPPPAKPAPALLASTKPADAPKTQAIAMVRLAQKYFEKYGLKKTGAAIDDPLNKDFHKGNVYAFILNFKGLMVAHGAAPALIGRNLYGLKDPDGKYINKDMAHLAQKGGGWYNYRWPNPSTHKIDRKASFVKKTESNLFCRSRCLS